MHDILTVQQMNPRSFEDWERISLVVKRAAPPTVEVTPVLLDNIRVALLSGEMSSWMFVNGNPMGIALTMIREDKLLGKKELIIYAAAGLRNMSTKDWDSCFEKMRLHSISKGCTHICFYTIVPRLVAMAKRMGGDVDTRYVSIPMGG